MNAPGRRAENMHIASSQRSLDHWYAERGNRDFPGVVTFPALKPPPVVCVYWRCGEPGKFFGGSAYCASHFPGAVS